jgi:WD40 repeat protein
MVGYSIHEQQNVRELTMLLRQHRIGDLPISQAQSVKRVRFLSQTMLATCGNDNRVRVWEWPSQRRLHDLPGSRFARDPQGEILYVASREPRSATTTYGRRDFQVANLSKIDLRTGQTITASEPAEIEMSALAVSPAGTMVAAARLTQPAVVFDAQTLQPHFHLKPPGKGTVGCIHFLDETRILTKGYTVNDYDYKVYLWDLPSQKPALKFSGAKTEIAVSPDGRFAAAGGAERGRVRVWSLSDGALLREFLYAEQHWVTETSFFHHAPLLAVVGQGASDRQLARLQVWNVESGQLLADFQPAGYPGWLLSVCVSPDDRWVVAGAGDGRLRVWDWQARTEQKSLSGHRDRVQSLVCLDDEWLLTSGNRDHTIRRWRINDSSTAGIEQAFDEIADQLAYSGVTRTLASSHGAVVRLWKARAGGFSGPDSLAGALSHPGVHQLCFCGNGKRLVTSGGDGTIRLWDVATQRELVRLEVHDEDSDHHVGWLALTPDEAGVAFTQMWSNRVAVWDWASREEVSRLDSGRRDLGPLGFAANGAWLAAGGADSGEITVWSWPERKIVHRFEAAGGIHINALRFCPASPDLLASADGDGNVELFDLRTGSRIANDNVESGQAWSLMFTPDGRRFIGGSLFGVIVVWELT